MCTEGKGSEGEGLHRDENFSCESADDSCNVICEEGGTLQGDKIDKTETCIILKRQEEEIQELRDALLSKEAECNGYLRKLERLQADFVNFRRRTEREHKELIARSNEELIASLLPILDNLERVTQGDRDPVNKELVAGVEMICQQFLALLKEEGVVPISPVGEVFDPKIHEAVLLVEDSGVEENIVVGELEKGYLIKDKVLRTSKVKVAK